MSKKPLWGSSELDGDPIPTFTPPPVRSVLQPGDHLERYGDAIYLSTPDPAHPKGRRIWYVITAERVGPPNVERIVAVEGFDAMKHDHH